MKCFIKGECRTQTTLFPESIDDYITDTNPVRIVELAVTGRHAYHPAILLKIYI